MLIATALLITLVVRSASIGVWDQCGGEEFEPNANDTTCDAELTCVRMDKYYSQCQPTAAPADTLGEGEQCGGTDFLGPTTCQGGLTCVFYDQTYSQCEQGSGAFASGGPASSKQEEDWEHQTHDTSSPDDVRPSYSSVDDQSENEEDFNGDFADDEDDGDDDFEDEDFDDDDEDDYDNGGDSDDDGSDADRKRKLAAGKLPANKRQKLRLKFARRKASLRRRLEKLHQRFMLNRQ